MTPLGCNGAAPVQPLKQEKISFGGRGKSRHGIPKIQALGSKKMMPLAKKLTDRLRWEPWEPSLVRAFALLEVLLADAFDSVLGSAQVQLAMAML